MFRNLFKHKVFLHHSENSAVGYYRVWQAAYWLDKLGLMRVKRLPDKSGVLPLNKKDRNELGSVEEIAKWADLMVWQRRETYLQFATLEALQEVYCKPIVYEIDDNLIEIDRNHPQYEVHREKSLNEAFDMIDVPEYQLQKYIDTKRVVKIGRHNPPDGWVSLMLAKEYDCGWLNKECLSKVTAITTTTQYLKELYQKINPNVYILPNCIDFEIWDKLPPVTKKDKIRIGWAGGWQHIKDMSVIIEPMKTILRRFPEVEFHYVRCRTNEMKRLETLFPNQVKFLGEGCKIQEWPQTYAGWDFDIGLAPLWISNFNKGKSNLKWLENSARKIPTVATDICTYGDIKNGETGYLCKDTKDWINALSDLIENPELREKIGRNAYEEVKSNFNAEDNAYLYKAVYTEIINKHKKGVNYGSNDESAGVKKKDTYDKTLCPARS